MSFLRPFAPVVYLASPHWPPAVVLVVATAAWSVTCGVAWMLVSALIRRP